jgi:hypothetical protein
MGGGRPRTFMTRRIRNRKSLLALVAAAATALALSSGAVAYYTSAGHGSSSASVASPDPLSITAQSPATNLLYPGGSGELDATVSNPNPFPVRINSLVLGGSGIAVDSGHSGCDTSAVHFASQSNGGSGWDVPAKVGATEGTLDLALAGAISMDTDAANACQGATFTISLETGP